jgi:hypothetical protein
MRCFVVYVLIARYCQGARVTAFPLTLVENQRVEVHHSVQWVRGSPPLKLNLHLKFGFLGK